MDNANTPQPQAPERWLASLARRTQRRIFQREDEADQLSDLRESLAQAYEHGQDTLRAQLAALTAAESADGERPVIRVRRRWAEGRLPWHAQIGDDATRWEAGTTAFDAVGGLLRSYPEVFGVQVEIEDFERQEKGEVSDASSH